MSFISLTLQEEENIDSVINSCLKDQYMSPNRYMNKEHMNKLHWKILQRNDKNLNYYYMQFLIKNIMSKPPTSKSEYENELMVNFFEVAIHVAKHTNKKFAQKFGLPLEKFSKQEIEGAKSVIACLQYNHKITEKIVGESLSHQDLVYCSFYDQPYSGFIINQDFWINKKYAKEVKERINSTNLQYLVKKNHFTDALNHFTLDELNIPENIFLYLIEQNNSGGTILRNPEAIYTILRKTEQEKYPLDYEDFIYFFHSFAYHPDFGQEQKNDIETKKVVLALLTKLEIHQFYTDKNKPKSEDSIHLHNIKKNRSSLDQLFVNNLHDIDITKACLKMPNFILNNTVSQFAKESSVEVFESILFCNTEEKFFKSHQINKMKEVLDDLLNNPKNTLLFTEKQNISHKMSFIEKHIINEQTIETRTARVRIL